MTGPRMKHCMTMMVSSATDKHQSTSQSTGSSCMCLEGCLVHYGGIGTCLCHLTRNGTFRSCLYGRCDPLPSLQGRLSECKRLGYRADCSMCQEWGRISPHPSSISQAHSTSHPVRTPAYTGKNENRHHRKAQHESLQETQLRSVHAQAGATMGNGSLARGMEAASTSPQTESRDETGKAQRLHRLNCTSIAHKDRWPEKHAGMGTHLAIGKETRGSVASGDGHVS